MKKLFIIISIIMVLVCSQSIGAMAQTTAIFPVRAASLPSIHSMDTINPISTDLPGTDAVSGGSGSTSGVFGTGSGSTSGVFGTGSVSTSGVFGTGSGLLDPLRPVDADTLGTGISLEDWLSPPDGNKQTHDSPLCPWKQ